MYLVPLKTIIVEAFEQVFDADYPEPDFRPTKISIEYPIDQSAYPGLWVQYEDRDELSVAGIGHVEDIIDTTVTPNTFGQCTRWRFAGTVTITCVALASLERDRLYDEVVRAFTSARFHPALAPLRGQIEVNDLVACNANFDDLRPFGDNAAPGTPWGTEEIIYEKSISFDLIGEFASDRSTGLMVPLSKVTFMDYVDGTEEPKFPTEAGSTTVPPTPNSWDRTKWS